MTKTYSYSAVLILVLMLAGCAETNDSSSDSDDDAVTGDTTLESIDGTWLSNCEEDALSSISADSAFIADNGALTAVATVYGNLACAEDILLQETFTFSYILGGAVTVDGSVAGITDATEIDITDTTAGSSGLGVERFEIIALQDDELYFGDCSGANDCSTAALRSTQLDGTVVYTRQ